MAPKIYGADEGMFEARTKPTHLHRIDVIFPLLPPLPYLRDFWFPIAQCNTGLEIETLYCTPAFLQLYFADYVTFTKSPCRIFDGVSSKSPSTLHGQKY